MKTTRRLLIGLTVSVLLPTAAMAQKVAYDFKHNGDFRNLKTFAFRDVPPTVPYGTPAGTSGTPKGSPHRTPKGTPSGSPYGPYQNGSFTEKTTVYDSPFVVERTRRAIASELQARGMREVGENENPDAFVTARRTFRTEQILYGPSGWGPYGWGWYGWGWGYGGPWYTEDIVKGTLIIDLEDANGALLWRGLREKTVKNHKKPEKRTEQVYEDVNKIFRKFPAEGPVATSGFIPSGVSSPQSGEGEGR